MDRIPDLGALLNPRSVAVIGATEGSGMGSHVVRNLLAGEFAGPIYPVNPKYASVFGLRCYPDIRDIQPSVDCAVIVQRADRVPDVLRGCADAGTRAAIVIASGFAETGRPDGLALQRDITGIARDSGMAMCGPNCHGNISLHSNAHLSAATFGGIPGDLQKGGVALVSQSGGLLMSALELGYNRGLGMSYLISSGNEAVTTSTDLFDFLVADPDTRVICAILEGFRDPARFLRVAERALDVGKPLIVLKIGRSERGIAAVSTHTAALAGSERVQRVILRERGVTVVRSVDELIETALVFSRMRVPAGRKMAAICISGGTVGLVADLAADVRLDLPQFSPATVRDLEGLLPEYSTIANPLDTTSQVLFNPELLEKLLRVTMADTSVDLVTFILPMRLRGGSENLRRLVPQMVAVAGSTTTPSAVVATVSEGLGDYWREAAASSPIPFVQDVQRGLQAISELVSYGELRLRWARRSSRLRREQDALVPVLSSPQLPPVAESDTVLAGSQALRLLESVGIRVPSFRVASDWEEAVRAASAIGYPVVMKADCRQLAHLSDHGLVRFPVANDCEAHVAFDEIVGGFASAGVPGAVLDGVIVEQLVADAHEVIVSARRDDEFGLTMLVGLGGIYVEAIGDVVMSSGPVDYEDSLEMVASIRGATTLTGSRGRPAADIDALAQTIVRVSQLAVGLGDRVRAIELNPLMVCPEGRGAVAVDCVISLDKTGGQGADHRG